MTTLPPLAVDPNARGAGRKGFGDFPTPPALVAEVLRALAPIGRFARVLEPTCGRGNFIAGLLDVPEPPREIRGFEIQPDHAEAARRLVDPSGRTKIAVETADLFRLDLGRDPGWTESGPLLVVGNLPWVTSSTLGALGRSNGPIRSNVRKLRGVDAITGGSNFDISEAIWLKLIRELAPERPTIALLGKTAVARSVLRLAVRDGLPVERATLWKVDARRWFRASVDACLLRVDVGPGPRAAEAPVFSGLDAREPSSTLGLGGDRMIADLDAYRRSSRFEGRCQLAWRQGVKHDAGSVMELVRGLDGLDRNKLGEAVDVEPDRVYPLLKGTDLAGPKNPRPSRSVIVTQRSLSDDTRALETAAPRLWAYLNSHADAFDRRKSAIYRGRPPFALFGVGDYTFAPFKVGISGLHKAPRFRAVGPVDGRPTLLDDTCYFLPCRTRDQAESLADALNRPEALDLIRALAFPDAKRPVTKDLLQRLDLERLRALETDRPWPSEWGTDWTKPSL